MSKDKQQEEQQQEQEQSQPQQPQNTPTDMSQTQIDFQAIQQQINDITSALQRERADAINLQRRYEEQIGSLKNVVKAEVVRDLLPVIDNFERALKHVPAELEGNDYIKGVQGVVKQFDKALEKLGVKKIDTVGKPFDPKYHEAVSMEEGDGAQEVVSEELQAGYVLGDDVVRHAMVKVKNQ